MAYEFDDDPARVDMDVVWGFLSTEAFARALSDGCAMAYLADVFVLAAHRGHGLGVRLVRSMIEEGSGARFRWMLHTRDAHGLYAKLGFVPADTHVLQRQSQL
jgi:GNAT superfamily N-acetyltransferase